MESNPWLPIIETSEQYARYWSNKLFEAKGDRTHADQWTELWEACLAMSDLAREASRRWDG